MRLNQRFSRLAPVALLVVGALIAGCSQAVTPAPEPEAYQPTPIPADVTELYRAFGNDQANTVWIFEQGGPLHGFDAFAYGHFSEFPELDHIHFVQVHQTLTLDQSLASRDSMWPLAELQAEVDVSVEILHRTIEHFKAQDKRVVVIGHSYGAFLVARYLAIKGPGTVDQYLVMAGRLDMPEVVVEGFRNGVEYWFPDAVNPEPFPVQGTRSPRDLMEMRIAAATGHSRYTRELADTDLQRVIYVYGTKDMSVGRLTEQEVAFLRSRGSTVIDVQDGGHTSMFEDAVVAMQISDLLSE